MATTINSRGSRLPSLRKLGGWVIVALAYFLGLVGFVIGFFGIAALVSSPAVFVGSGIAVGAVVVYAGSCLSARVLRSKRKVRYAAMHSGLFSVLLFGLITTMLLKPLVPQTSPVYLTPHEGVEYWDLRTGSTVAVRHFPGEGNNTPIVYIHGGPGAYSVLWQPIVNTVSQLSAAGHDVYFYDQVGGGLSQRLDNIEAYSLTRHIEDLQAIRETIGAEKIIVLASSFGATLTTNYMVEYPGSVALAVFSSPGPMYKPDWIDQAEGSLDDTLSVADRDAFSTMINRPRLFAALILSDINAAAAVNFASEQELGSFFDAIANRFYLRGAMCESSKIDAVSTGYGFWSNKMTGNTLLHRTDDPKPSLQHDSTPVLVLRGECDYKTKAVAEQYVSVFPNAILEDIQRAGHFLVYEQPEI
ncbi:MAG: alpha/beta hydrolase, partial [Pseudomonadota bacterium]